MGENGPNVFGDDGDDEGDKEHRHFEHLLVDTVVRTPHNAG